MKRFLNGLLLIFISLLICFCSYKYLNGLYKLAGIYAGGIFFGIFFMLIHLNIKNDKINSYKRELEKESVSSDESSAKVKVLESKIKVLEKALENAINKSI